MDDRSLNDNYPRRHYPRLRQYDYSRQGDYFITICTKNNLCLFGEITRNKMILNQFGEAVKTVWQELPLHYPEVKNDIFIIMPNHFHGIVSIRRNWRSGQRPDPTIKQQPLSEIVRAFKSYSSREVNKIRNTSGIVTWQRSFYEHVIRDETEYRQIGEYILFNPAKWKFDRNNPRAKASNRNSPFES